MDSPPPITETDNVYSLEELRDWPEDQLASLDVGRLSATSNFALARFLERLDVDERRTVLRHFAPERASEVLAEVDGEMAAETLAAMREERALDILDEIEPDDAADILAEMEDADRERLLPKLEQSTRGPIESLLEYEPETAGGIMTTEVDYAYADLGIPEAFACIRNLPERGEDIAYIYIVDRQHRLQGILPLRKLIQARPDQKLSDLIKTDFQGVVLPDTDQEQVARLMAESNLPNIAVVDAEGRLLGMVTHDDILDVITAEATEDIQKLSGAGGDESLHDDVLYSVRRRQPWLLVNLATAFIASSVVWAFSDEISALPFLATLMPIIAALGGNSGQQALAVAIRSLALNEIHPGEERQVLLKQLLIGLINGSVIGLAAAVAIGLFSSDWSVGLLVWVAMIGNMLLAGLAGACIPLILRRLHRDPAQSSSILLTAVTDTGGFFLILGLGSWLLL